MKSTGIAEPDKKKVGSTPEGVSGADLAEITGRTDRAIRLRAEKEEWPCSLCEVRGGRQKLFPVAALPADIRRAVLIHYGEIPEHLAECVPVDFDPEKIRRCSEAWDRALEWQREFARDRHAILQALDRFREDSRQGRRSGRHGDLPLQKTPGRDAGSLPMTPGNPPPASPRIRGDRGGRSLPRPAGTPGRLTRRAAVQRFVRLFQECEVPGLDPEIYGRVRKISRTQIYEWERKYGTDGIAGLISRNGHARGKSVIPPDQQGRILGYFAKWPHVRHAKIERLLAGEFGDLAVSRRQVTTFLLRREAADPAVFALLRNPDEYQSKFRVAIGNAAERAEHFLHYIEVDSTPADVQCADGRRYAIVGGIDVFSRKARFVLVPTSNTWGIAGMLRAIILDWGIPENVVRDNGQDYASETIRDAMLSLEIGDHPVPPFTPQAKPHIERVFRTLATDLFETLPGFIGHNVAERQALRARVSFADRLMKRGDVIECGLTPGVLQGSVDRWTEQVYHQAEHGTLRVSPNAKQASVPYRPRRIPDPHVVDMLLAGRKPRTWSKEGIRWGNGRYWATELELCKGMKLEIREDIRDASRIYVFDRETHEFVCIAEDLSLSGLTVGDKIAARKRAAKADKARANAVKVLAQDVGDPLDLAIAAARRNRATVANLPVGDAVEGNPFVDAAMRAAEAAREGTPLNPPVNGGRQENGSDPASLPGVFGSAGVSAGTGGVPASLPGDCRGRDATGGDNPNVIPIARKQVLDEPLYFDNARERFEHFRVVQRTQPVSDWDIKLIVSLINEWFGWADQFAETWPESDRRWLGKIAPDHFPQYVEMDYREDGK